ncbi:hypothetical protein V2I01_21805 [Micromonospora sp. BRA006-A]|nr:hypothetical protein [Micromonospora sp. BRA006-A]
MVALADVTYVWHARGTTLAVRDRCWAAGRWSCCCRCHRSSLWSACSRWPGPRRTAASGDWP